MVTAILFSQAYHSQIREFSSAVGNIAILPLRTQSRGPAPMANIEQDIIDESLYYFKANVFFRTYEVKVPSFVPWEILMKFKRFFRNYSRRSIERLST